MGARDELLTVLRRLYWYTWQPERLSHDTSICTYVVQELRDDEAFRLWHARRPDLFKSWRYYSGSLPYPVPAPAGVYHEDYYLVGSLWAGRQRMLRRDLLRHIMAEL